MTYPRWTSAVDWPNAPESLINQPTFPSLSDFQANIRQLQRVYSTPYDEWVDEQTLGNVSNQFYSDTYFEQFLTEFYKLDYVTPTKWTLAEIEAIIGTPYNPTLRGTPISAADLTWRYEALNLLNIFPARDYFDNLQFSSGTVGDAKWNNRWTYSFSSGTLFYIDPSAQRLVMEIPAGGNAKLFQKPFGSRVPSEYFIFTFPNMRDINTKVTFTGLGYSIILDTGANTASVKGPDLSTAYTTAGLASSSPIITIQLSRAINPTTQDVEYTMDIGGVLSSGPYTNTSTVLTNPGRAFQMESFANIGSPATKDVYLELFLMEVRHPPDFIQAW